MGLLVDGVWRDEWYDTKSSYGEFIRTDAQFRSWISADASTGFQAESGRYHLFVSLACPWAHRTLVFRALKGLEDVISVSIVKPEMLSQGWEFQGGDLPDGMNGLTYMHQVYTSVQPNYSGRVTVPVLYDKKSRQIVSNESSEIIRMLNTAFNDFASDDVDYYPESKRQIIDELNADVYENINNGVYKTGFATTQAAYEKNFEALFEALGRMEVRLSESRYLAGDTLTEADWRLFTTLVRFDAVYVGHFKCNLKRIEDYPNLSNYLRELYQIMGIAETVDFEHIKTHYYYSHDMINPTRIVPMGPDLALERAHDRDRF
ncbi:glutathione-dependent reductase [Oleiphilus sp. HI0009]|nr:MULTISPECIES: glutathione S-transferase family protein [unclassified Oleiphilus]KZX84527.1 glutathione-dependent reductase [Oleiphilus sp. HI0009]KZY63513.1 glutathione-dependent reductase [Oleiphilus sp. HI0066]KZY69107.1 glutathione-dependent reductase [Oleiphilus sp. HI0067]